MATFPPLNRGCSIACCKWRGHYPMKRRWRPFVVAAGNFTVSNRLFALGLLLGRGQLAVQLIGLGGHDEIVAVQVADFVSPPGNAHSSPLGGQLRVVALTFRQLSNGVGKG